MSGQREEGREGGGRGRKALGRGAVGLSLLLSEKGGGWSVVGIDKGSWGVGGKGRAGRERKRALYDSGRIPVFRL